MTLRCALFQVRTPLLATLEMRDMLSSSESLIRFFFPFVFGTGPSRCGVLSKHLSLGVGLVIHGVMRLGMVRLGVVDRVVRLLVVAPLLLG